MAVLTIGSLGILIETLTNSRKTVDQINQVCSDKGLPPAFPIDEDGNPEIPGNPDYRFEGFGVIAGFPPMVQFWVHYSYGNPEHVELGRFTIEIGFGKFLQLSRLIGK